MVYIVSILKNNMSNRQPTQAQITRFEEKYDYCAGPTKEGSYYSLIDGKTYTPAWIARNIKA